MKTVNREILTLQELKRLLLLANDDELQVEVSNTVGAERFSKPWSIDSVEALLAQLDYSDSRDTNSSNLRML
jgi:hypothetical protein